MNNIKVKNLAKKEDCEQEVTLVGIIDNSAKRMATMIDSILKFSRIDQEDILNTFNTIRLNFKKEDTSKLNNNFAI